MLTTLSSIEYLSLHGRKYASNIFDADGPLEIPILLYNVSLHNRVPKSPPKVDHFGT
jgi:hypothetical protein